MRSVNIKLPVWALVLVTVVLTAMVTATTVVASSGRSPGDNRHDDVYHRNDAYNKAKALYPDPHPVNFPMRKQLVDMTNREDKVNHPFYIYVLSFTGQYIGYYVGKFAPENSCNFLSSTEDIYHGDKADVKMQAPSYDGVYYGNSACNEQFFFDVTTNALIKIGNLSYVVSDQPLKVNAPRIVAR